MRESISSVVAGVVAGLLFLAVPAQADEFWKAWGDGKAELAGYALVQPRYGHLREGSAVLVFVTEDFSDSLRVKADPGKHAATDVYPVLKLNFVRDFQTGIYDYNVLTSTFVKTEDPSLPAVKVSFSAQEWCGHAYQQWLRRGEKLVGVSHSYFDGEADTSTELAIPPGGILEEQLPILVRGLRGDWLKPGESRTMPFLPSALRSRFAHKLQAWGEATVSRAAASATLATRLGKLAAWTYTVAEKGGDTLTFTVEDAGAHRLLAWRSSTGEAGTILGSARLPYWEEHDPGDEKYLKLIGLTPQKAPSVK